MMAVPDVPITIRSNAIAALVSQRRSVLVLVQTLEPLRFARAVWTLRPQGTAFGTTRDGQYRRNCIDPAALRNVARPLSRRACVRPGVSADGGRGCRATRAVYRRFGRRFRCGPTLRVFTDFELARAAAHHGDYAAHP